MNGDFSRITFDPRKHFSTVLMQQGRVHLDAEWNEQQAVHRYRAETVAVDTIGSAGAPVEASGFSISLGPDQRTLLIGPGRMYVQGVLCENDAATPIKFANQPDLPAPPDVVGLLSAQPATFGLVFIDVWQRHVTGLDDPALLEPALNGVDTTTRLKTIWQVKVLPIAFDLQPFEALARRGLDVLAKVRAIATQPAMQASIDDVVKRASEIVGQGPSPGHAALLVTLPVAIGEFLEVLVAQNIPDAQVALAAAQTADTLIGPPLAFAAGLCRAPSPEWTTLVTPSSGQLKAQTVPTEASTPCLVAPTAGFQGLENQLYRVEIHQPGDTRLNQPVTFKWSRDNGSVATAVAGPIAAGDTHLTVDSLGPDEALGLRVSDTIELRDDDSELNGQPGQLFTIMEVDRATRVLTLDHPVPISPPPAQVARRAKIRRWDGSATVTPNSWQILEEGLQVQFTDGTYRTDDYWVIPARTGIGIEWPAAADGSPGALNPAGIRHHFARLAVIALEPAGTLSAPPGPGTGGLDESQRPLPLLRLAAAREALGLAPPAAAGGDAGPILVVSGDCRPQFNGLASPAPAMHVVGTSWRNDSLMSIQQLLLDGLQLVLDDPPDPKSVTASTVIVTLELPQPNSPLLSTSIVDGQVSTTDNVISWRIPQPRLQAMGAAFTRPLAASVSAVRARVTVKGHALWAADGPRRRYLDGQAFGAPGPSSTDLVLPSGCGAAASDFESWFFLGSTERQVLEVRSVAFMLAGPAGAALQTVRVVPLPPFPPDPASLNFNFGNQRFNTLEVGFSRAAGVVPPTTLADVVHVEFTPPGGQTGVLPGTVTPGATTLRFTAAPGELQDGSFVPGTYTLNVVGSRLVAQDDGTPLDGRFSGSPPTDFTIQLSVLG